MQTLSVQSDHEKRVRVSDQKGNTCTRNPVLEYASKIQNKNIHRTMNAKELTVL
jgi:hypothetical protein